MKQLDGLKSLPTARVAVRRFLSEGLEAMGPAGACVRASVRVCGHVRAHGSLHANVQAMFASMGPAGTRVCVPTC